MNWSENNEIEECTHSVINVRAGGTKTAVASVKMGLALGTFLATSDYICLSDQ